MIIIADSGSTKTDWVVQLPNNESLEFKTPGMNPFFIDVRAAQEFIEKEIISQIDLSNIHAVYFYGAGCVGSQNVNLISQILKSTFKNSNIQVDNDLLGAARATLGDKRGIPCILGTGSNSCFYNGRKIIDQIPPLGYVLGDEGSGAYLGKQLIADYFKKVMPGYLAMQFNERFHISKDQVLNKIYKERFPNRYLADFAWFLFEYKNEPYCYNLTKNALIQFFERNICKYENYKLYELTFTGSVAFFLEGLINQVADEFEVSVTKICKSPVRDLFQYHLKK